MSGCLILWPQPVKMSHLSSGDPSVLSFCVVCVCGRMGPSVCQDVSSFGHSLSRCPIFRQVILLSFRFVLYVCVDVWVLVCVRMSHPLATACQDVPSFVR